MECGKNTRYKRGTKEKAMKSVTVTQEEKQVIEMIRNHPNKELALLKAIEIFTSFNEKNE